MRKYFNPMLGAILILPSLLLGMATPAAFAQDDTAQTQPAPIAITAPEISDQANIASDRAQLDRLIVQRLSAIYDEIDDLNTISVSARSGIITLSGEVANDEQASEAIALAERIDGAILVRDKITRLRDLESNLSLIVEQFSKDLNATMTALPLFVFALVLFLIIVFLGHILARWTSLWRRVLPNIFLAELVAQAVRIAVIIIGLVIALNLIGATALMGTILGGAGVAGIAIGFAVRDTLENYVSSIMLSLRQPFRANDHVVIDSHEGIVMRLTSRATILMTMDGNHLRIPNADVFKGIILNYTRNPERRFDFVLGIDAEDDPVEGMETGLAALQDLSFLLCDPKPNAAIEEVGDSNIVLRFYAWVDQRSADFLKSRSMAICAAKTALEDAGFTLPEPIYRLRLDGDAKPKATDYLESMDKKQRRKVAEDRPESQHSGTDPDMRPSGYITETIEKERKFNHEDDLLDEGRPVE